MKLSTLPSPCDFLHDCESNPKEEILKTPGNLMRDHPQHQPPLYHRQHSRNRSLDSAQVQSYLQFNVSPDILDDLDLNPLQLHLVSVASSKSHATDHVTNDRILSLKQQNHFHFCRLHRDSESSESPDPQSSGMGVVVVCPSKLNKCTCACAVSSDDSGICSGASGTTGSETDDVTSSVACDHCEDDPNDDTDGHDFNCGSPRLSFDSAIIMAEGDGFDESTDTLLLNINDDASFMKCGSGEKFGEDFERTLTNHHIQELTPVTEVSNSSTPPPPLFVEDQEEGILMSTEKSLPVVIENVVAPSPSSSSSSGGTSLFSRIRVNARNSKFPATIKTTTSTTSPISPQSGSSSSSNIASGMRSKLRLNFGKEKKAKSLCLLESNSVKISAEQKEHKSLSIVEDKELEKVVREEDEKNAQEEMTISRRLQGVASKSWLLRFFESQVFNMSYAIGYLFSSKVLQFSAVIIQTLTEIYGINGCQRVCFMFVEDSYDMCNPVNFSWTLTIR